MLLWDNAHSRAQLTHLYLISCVRLMVLYIDAVQNHTLWSCSLFSIVLCKVTHVFNIILRAVSSAATDKTTRILVVPLTLLLLLLTSMHWLHATVTRSSTNCCDARRRATPETATATVNELNIRLNWPSLVAVQPYYWCSRGCFTTSLTEWYASQWHV